MKSQQSAVFLSVGLAAAVAAIAGLAGCRTASPAATEATPTESPAAVAAGYDRSGPGSATAPGQTNIHTGDILYQGNRITIVFSGIPNPPEAHMEQIRNDGYITPPLLGKPVMAAGKTIGDLQQELHDLYVPAYFVTLTITVKSEERYFFVKGEVKMSGQKPYLSEMTVLKAIAAAQDFTDFANRAKVQIIRANGRTETVNCKKALQNPKLDLPIYPGDTVNVPRRWP